MAEQDSYDLSGGVKVLPEGVTFSPRPPLSSIPPQPPAKRQVAEQIGSATSYDRDGVSESIFSISTPSKGVRIGPVTLSGRYQTQQQSVTPEALGYSEDQQQKGSSYNVGIASQLPGGILPPFMESVLRPESGRISYGRSKGKVTTPFGQSFSQDEIMRGIGGQGRVLTGLFGDNAPVARMDYQEHGPDSYDLSGGLSVPLEWGDLEGYVERKRRPSLEEGRKDFDEAGVRVRIPLQEGGIVSLT